MDESLRKELSEFTPIELMKELAHRGYSGKLEYPEIRVVDISKI